VYGVLYVGSFVIAGARTVPGHRVRQHPCAIGARLPAGIPLRTWCMLPHRGQRLAQVRSFGYVLCLAAALAPCIEKSYRSLKVRETGVREEM
jgi:hypothetical protein